MNSMNNLLLYCGLVDAKIRADINLPVNTSLSYLVNELFQEALVFWNFFEMFLFQNVMDQI